MPFRAPQTHLQKLISGSTPMRTIAVLALLLVPVLAWLAFLVWGAAEAFVTLI